jgi:cell division protein FtsN
MTQDFAKKTRAPAKRKPANNKRSTPPPKPKSQVPGWVWLFTGTILGAFIMFLAYLSGITPQPSLQPASQVAQPTPTKNEVPKPRFDFYQLLKETEVVVKETPAHTPKETAALEAQEFILQVGSFKKTADADRLRAELILMNLEAQVETVTVRNGETWHRVLVGPYQSRSKVAKARSTLVSNDINPLLLKRKRS